MNANVKTLHDRFMEIDPTIRGKSMIRKSNEMIDNNVSHFGADKSSITGSKKLANCKELRDVNNAKQAIYKYIICNSLQLGKFRVISPARFIKIKQDLDKMIEDLQKLMQIMVDKWPTIVKDDELRMGTLYNAKDYPSVEELKASFGATIVFRPLPDFSNFNVTGLDANDSSQLMQTLNDSLQEDVNGLVQDLLRKLIFGSDPDRNNKEGNGLLYSIARLASADSFKQNTLDNVKDIAQAVKDLNALDIPELNAFADKLINIFNVDADSLRDSKQARVQIVNDSQAALAEIEKAMQGFV